jgi:hypothetical protein
MQNKFKIDLEELHIGDNIDLVLLEDEEVIGEIIQIYKIKLMIKDLNGKINIVYINDIVGYV